MKRREFFNFEHKRFAYFDHPYNHASDNMRSVEVPLARHFLSEFDPARVIEVGDVLRHYGDIAWRVIDLYGTDIRADMLEWAPPRKLQAIVSISTLEHVGYGKYVGTGNADPQAIVRHLRGWLGRGGRMLATIPLGYNPAWDEAIRSNVLGCKQFFMARLNEQNEWKQTGQAHALALNPHRWPWGAAVAILRWDK